MGRLFSLSTTRAAAVSAGLLPLTLLLYAVVVAYGSLMPLMPADSWGQLWDVLKSGLTLEVHRPVWATVTERLLTFVPMGILAGLQMQRLGRRHAMIAAAGLVGLLALAIEIAQATVIGRHPRLTDFILATLFGCIGAANSRLVKRLAGAMGDLPRQRWTHTHSLMRSPSMICRRIGLGWFLLCAIVVCNITIVFALVVTHSGMQIAGWNCSYPILIGNEFTQDRPWSGRIRSLAIYDRAPSERGVRELSRVPMTDENSGVRRQAGALLLYSFAAVKGGIVPNLGLIGTRGDLNVTTSAPDILPPSEGALELDGRQTVRGMGKELCDRITGTQAFSVEADIASSNLRQRGPARIVSMSIDTLERNFTLGEDQGALTLRVRTPRNGPNGTQLPVQTDSHAVTGAWQHVWVGYGDGQAAIYIDGQPAVATTAAYKVLVLDEERPPVPVSQVAALFCFAGGALAGLLFAQHKVLRSLLLGSLSVAAIPMLVAFVLETGFAYKCDQILLVVAILAACLGSAVGMAIVHRSERSTGSVSTSRPTQPVFDRDRSRS